MTLDQTMVNAGDFRGTASPARLSIDSVRDRVRDYSYRPITADDGALSAAVLVPLYHLGNGSRTPKIGVKKSFHTASTQSRQSPSILSR